MTTVKRDLIFVEFGQIAEDSPNAFPPIFPPEEGGPTKRRENQHRKIFWGKIGVEIWAAPKKSREKLDGGQSSWIFFFDSGADRREKNGQKIRYFIRPAKNTCVQENTIKSKKSRLFKQLVPHCLKKKRIKKTGKYLQGCSLSPKCLDKKLQEKDAKKILGFFCSQNVFLADMTPIFFQVVFHSIYFLCVLFSSDFFDFSPVFRFLIVPPFSAQFPNYSFFLSLFLGWENVGPSLETL